MIQFADGSLSLKGLVDSLTHHEIRHLQSAIEDVDLHCDIVAQLPFDISLMILQYLPIHQIFQARRVSSQWRQMLSPTRTVDTFLRDWYPCRKDDVSQILQIPAGLSAENVASLKAEHVDAFRTGHPFKYAHCYFQCASNPQSLYRMVYADGLIAFADERNTTTVRTLDIKTGQELSFIPPARTQVRAFALSLSMIAVLTSATCHIWTLKTGQIHKFRLPSDRRASIAVSGNSLALVYHHSQFDPASHIHVVTWTLKNQRTSSFFLASSPNNYSSDQSIIDYEYTIMLDGNGETMLLLERAHTPGIDGLFSYFRTSLDGKILAQGSLEIVIPKDSMNCLRGASPTEVNGRAVIWSYVSRQPRERAYSELMLIYYNFRENRLEVHKKVITNLHIMSERISNFVFWKDVAYFLEYYNGRWWLSVIDLENWICREAKNKNYILTSGCDEVPLALLGDERFLITGFKTGCRVWCFDANVQVSNKDDSFEMRREKNREERLLLKKDTKDSKNYDSPS